MGVNKLQLAKAMQARIKELMPEKTIKDVYNWLQSVTYDEEIEAQLRSYVTTARVLQPGEKVNGRRVPQDLDAHTRQEIEHYISEGGKILLIEYHNPETNHFTRILQYHDFNGQPIKDNRVEELKEHFISQIIFQTLVEKLVDKFLEDELGGESE
jgi:hypothetical protein